MNDITLAMSTREIVGKRVRQVRQAGFTPSVVYGGKGGAAQSTQAMATDTTKVVRAAGKHTPVHLVLDGKKKLALIKSIDRDPVKHTVRHVAFHMIKQNEKVVAEVPVVLVNTGESLAEKAGLVVLQALEQVEVRALPAHLPESIEVSVEKLHEAGDKITLEDVTLPEGVEYADVEQDTSLAIASVYEPSALQAANDAVGGDAEDVEAVEVENGADEPVADATTTEA